MNIKRRKRLREILTTITDVSSEIETLRDEEDEARDNMPESFQDTDRYSESEEASDAMDSAIDSLNDAATSIEAVL